MQRDIKDCGAACMLSILKYLGGNYPYEQLKMLINTTKSGTTAYDIIDGFNTLGINSDAYSINFETLTKSTSLCPFIASVTIDNSYKHFVVVYKIDKRKKTLIVMDPSKGMTTYSFDKFKSIFNEAIIIAEKRSTVVNVKQTSINKFIFNIMKPHKKTITCIMLLSAIFTIFSLINSYYLKYLLNVIEYKDYSNLIKLSVLFILVIIIKSLSQMLRNNATIMLSSKITYEMITKTFKHIISLPYKYYKVKTTGEMIERINDIMLLKDIIVTVITTLLVDVVMLLSCTIIIFTISKQLFLILLIAILVYVPILLVCNPILKTKYFSSIRYNEKSYSYLTEMLHGYDTVKGLNIEKEVISKYSYLYKYALKHDIDFSKFVQSINFIKDLIENLIIFSILLVGSFLVINDDLSIPNLLLINTLMLYLLTPLNNIASLDLLFKQGNLSINRINELFTIETESFNITNKYSNQIQNGNIVINNLNFNHNHIQILRDINIKINSGEKVIIKGESGAGKSTLLKLICKYYEVERGQIEIDSKDINDYDLSEIRSEIRYVSQNEVLFNDTLYNNINITNTPSNYDCIEDISKDFYVSEIYKQNNVGLNMLIEESGFNLSGGQKQRVTLARSLVKDFNILILDEALSQMDIKLERKILKNLFSKYPNKTIIVISHRNDNDDLFDKIIHLKGTGG